MSPSPAFLRAIYNEDVDRLLAESRAVWTTFAADRKFRYEVQVGAEQLPAIFGRVEAVDVTLHGYGNRTHGFATHARATAKYPMRGRVLVRPKTSLDDLLAWIRDRDPLGDAALDAILAVRSSSDSLRRAVLDERSVEVIRALASRPLHEFRYKNGDIFIAWPGIERTEKLMTDVLEALAHLAVTGSEASPYR